MNLFDFLCFIHLEVEPLLLLGIHKRPVVVKSLLAEWIQPVTQVTSPGCPSLVERTGSLPSTGKLACDL